MLAQKALHQLVPLGIEALVGGEDAVGDPGGERQHLVLEFEVEKDAGQIRLGIAAAYRGKCLAQIFR